MNYFEYGLRIMAPLTCGTATKLEAVAMITGAVSLFARSAAQAHQGSPSLFGTASPQEHPYLIAALTEPGPPSPLPDLFEQTIRSVLRGWLDGDPCANCRLPRQLVTSLLPNRAHAAARKISAVDHRADDAGDDLVGGDRVAQQVTERQPVVRRQVRVDRRQLRRSSPGSG